MKRRTVARSISVVLLGYFFGLWLVSIDHDSMASYRSLSHDALLAVLAEKHDGDFTSNFAGGVVFIGLVVLMIDGLTALIEWIINKISPLPAAAPLVLPEGSAGAGGPPFH
jgi:hypothetical protein